MQQEAGNREASALCRGRPHVGGHWWEATRGRPLVGAPWSGSQPIRLPSFCSGSRKGVAHGRWWERNVVEKLPTPRSPRPRPRPPPRGTHPLYQASCRLLWSPFCPRVWLDPPGSFRSLWGLRGQGVPQRELHSRVCL